MMSEPSGSSRTVRTNGRRDNVETSAWDVGLADDSKIWDGRAARPATGLAGSTKVTSTRASLFLFGCFATSIGCHTGQQIKPKSAPSASAAAPVAAPDQNPSRAEREALPDDYFAFTLSWLNDKWTGTSEQLSGFSVSLEIPGYVVEDGLDPARLISVIKRQPVKGTVVYPDGKTTPIVYEVVNHRGREDIYMKSSLGYFLWERTQIVGREIEFAIYWWYCPPAQPVDLEILALARQLLADPAHWNQKDDRECDDDEKDNRWSLFCALKFASLQKAGEYNHHNTATQTVRFVIDEKLPKHGFTHTLMDYNNAPSTKHDDILSVLEMAERRIRDAIRQSTRTPYEMSP